MSFRGFLSSFSSLSFPCLVTSFWSAVYIPKPVEHSMKKIPVILLLVCGFLVPRALFAEGIEKTDLSSQKQPVSSSGSQPHPESQPSLPQKRTLGDLEDCILTPRAQRIYDQAPQTPQELFRLIREFRDNPDMMDGYELGERASGVDRAYWQPGSQSKGFAGHKDIIKQRYYIRSSRCYSSPSSKKGDKLPVPYRMFEIKVNAETDALLDIFFYFNEIPGITFEVTPALVQEIMGEPTEIYVSSPRTFNNGKYYLKYYYKNKYKLQILFLAPGDDNKELLEERKHHTGKQIKAERRWRRQFANHKDFKAIDMRLSLSRNKDRF